jgi:hypothetical protein
MAFLSGLRQADPMRFLPLVPVPLVLLVLLIFRPGLLRAGVDSPKAAGVGVGIALIGLLVLAVVRRRSWAAGLWTSSAVVLALMAVVLWPAFRERTVNEAFPVVLTVPLAVPPAVSTVAPTVAPIPRATPPAVVATTAPAPVRTSPRPAATQAPSSAKPAATAAPVVAVRMLGGRWHGIHHTASGGASLYKVGGQLFLRFEDIRFQGTPGPSVHLVAAGKRTPGGGIRLGGLKGERGSFSYRVPAGFDVSRGWTALVWCDTYDTPIAAADLT